MTIFVLVFFAVACLVVLVGALLVKRGKLGARWLMLGTLVPCSL